MRLFKSFVLLLYIDNAMNPYIAKLSQYWSYIQHEDLFRVEEFYAPNEFHHIQVNDIF